MSAADLPGGLFARALDQQRAGSAAHEHSRNDEHHTEDIVEDVRGPRLSRYFGEPNDHVNGVILNLVVSKALTRRTMSYSLALLSAP